MPNVLIDRDKLDVLANAISAKSGEALTLTLDEMVDAVDGIETGGGITPTGNIDITSAGVTDVTNYATATVASATINDEIIPHNGNLYIGVNSDGTVDASYTDYEVFNIVEDAGFVDENTTVKTMIYHSGSYQLPTQSATSITPTETAQTAVASGKWTTGAVTVNAIPSNYVGSGVTQRTSSDLSASGATVTAPSGYYASSATKTIASGTEGTPTATKGTVTNHSVTVTPSVTNTAGYISGGSHSGTAVSVTASELVSGSQTVTENDTYDVTNLATLVVNVSGGGGGSVAVGTKTATLSASASSIQFTGLSGNPTSFVVTSSADQSTGGTKAVAVAWDGTSFHGMDVTTQAEADTGFSKTYSSGTLTITATTATFEANEYKLVYTYGGSSSDIHTADVQVGSGATSITFSSLSGRPIYFSCVFKSTFSTSSGYQRVIEVVNDGTSTYGHAFDSSAKAQTSWTYSYSGGSLTITSSGTNNGGYFHQPGYYQLTYAVDDSAPQYETISKTYRASTSAQSETIQPSSGYDAIEQVSVSIPAVSQTNLTAANIKSGTTISISNGSTNLWSVTGTYSGGGGGSASVATTTWTNSSTSTVSHQFTGLLGTPIAAFLRCTTQLTRSSSNTYYYIADIFWDGTNAYGNYHLRSNGSYNNVASNANPGFTVTTGTNSITFTSGASSRSSAPGSFYNGTYELTYIY